MTKKLMATAAVVAILTATGAARADELSDLQAQAHLLKKQNEMLAKRIAKIEKRQAKDRAEMARQTAARPPAKSFLDYLPSIKGPAECAPLNLDGPLTFCGITIYGAVDAGLGYASHGAPVNGNMYWGNVMVHNYNRGGYFGIVPNGLSQTTVGIKGEEHIYGDWSGIFHASTGINPQSGQLANAPGSLVDNNGLPPNATSLHDDGTRGGQAFNDELYIGVKSHTLGQLTFGRQKSVSNEVIVGHYDPANGAYNYSLIGFSGSPVAGGGDTDDGRIDDVLKYKVGYGPVHFEGMYKFASGSAGTNSLVNPATGNPYCGGAANGYACNLSNWAWQADAGISYMNFNIDVLGGHFNQAVTYGTFPVIGSQLLSGTASDNDDIMVGANYTWQQFKFFAGWAHDVYHNPSDPIGFGANTGQGSYSVGAVTNTKYTHAKTLDTEWGGIQYHYNPQTMFAVAYYHEGQNNYSGAACSGNYVTESGACSGDLNYVSGFVDYHFTKRFDVYGGLMYAAVSGGMEHGYNAHGYHNSDIVAPTAGLRFKF